MKIWIIKTLEKESELDDLNTLVNNELINANLRTYKNNPDRFSDKRYHPEKDLVAMAFNVSKVVDWSAYILKHVSELDLQELSEDWEQELYG
jgi:hypothetical protein